MSLVRKAFKRRYYPVDIIAQCVRWVMRRVPLPDRAFRRHKRCSGGRWRMDETYINVKGQWKYLYRSVDTEGRTIAFLLTAKRAAPAALRFFRKAIRQHGEADVVTIDKSGANTAVLAELNASREADERIKVRQSRYLNNLTEQDQQNIKRRIRLMTGFKSFRRAQTILAGIEILQILRKGQLQHPHGDSLSPAAQFYLLVA
ncbi:TPA: IS6 family transposase [Escherichia coli]|nr:IS6 family transposase [Escherichia coli]